MYRAIVFMVFSMFLVACNNGVTTDPVELEWQATLGGVGDWAHLQGASTVVSTAGLVGFDAIASLEGDTPGSVRPWHVHFNTCAEGGGIVGTDAAYPRLEVGPDGTATAAVTIAQPLQAGASYHVNVHRSDAELETIIACGDLILTN